jgi:uncharacterized membrane protein SirB2
MDYLALKHLHMGFAALSGVFFLVRGLWMLAGSALLQARFTRVAPHIIDTGLLASAIGLAVWSHQSPGQHSWLAAKIVALLVYIVLGTIALKRGKTRQVRAIAFVLALMTFAYIVGTAVTRNPAWVLPV